MQVSLESPQSPYTYVLSKIDRIYGHQKTYQEKKRLQAAVKYRQQMANAEKIFQKRLNQALSPMLQKGLGIRSALDQNSLPLPRFVAEFKFLGKYWVIKHHPDLFGGFWEFGDPTQLTRCRTAQLETRLCYTLGKYKNIADRRLRFALLPAGSDFRV